MKFLFGCLFVILILTICLNTNYLETSRWKYSDGFHVGDVIDFSSSGEDNSSLFLNNQSIYLNDKLVGRLVYYNHRELIIESLEKEKGYYVFFDYKK